jgi:hypothetical protein
VSTSEVLELLLFKKHEHSECNIHAFALAFALETTRAKRVPYFDFTLAFAFDF